MDGASGKVQIVVYNPGVWKKYYEKNKQKIRKEQRNRYDPEKERDRRYKRKYGLSLQDYLDIYSDQNGCCEICKNWQDTLHVDHDHKTNRLRFLLCRDCNLALGLFKDNKEVILNAAAYLERFETTNSAL